jgi:prepilin-type N-terminal cleavage/methylation domain-containing protein
MKTSMLSRDGVAGKGHRAMGTEPKPAGVTLVELVVTIAIVGVLFLMAGLAYRRTLESAPTLLSQIASVRSNAVREARQHTALFPTEEYVYSISAYPDGRVLVDSVAVIDNLSGRPADE